MTIGPFFLAMRRGATEKAARLTRQTNTTPAARTNPAPAAQQQTRQASTQAAAVPKKVDEKAPMDQWDYLVIDVSTGSLRVSISSVDEREAHQLRSLVSDENVSLLLGHNLLGIWRALGIATYLDLAFARHFASL